MAGPRDHSLVPYTAVIPSWADHPEWYHRLLHHPTSPTLPTPPPTRPSPPLHALPPLPPAQNNPLPPKPCTDLQIASLANISSNYLIANTEASRWGTAHPSIVPYQVFRTADGYIMLAAGNDSQFRTLCSAAILDQPQWAQDEKFATNSARVKHRDEVVRMIEEVLGKKGTGEWCEVLTGKGYVNSSDAAILVRKSRMHVAGNGRGEERQGKGVLGNTEP